MSDKTPLLEVVKLRTHFPVRSGLMHRVTGAIRAVDGVSLSLHAGRKVSLIGRSMQTSSEIAHDLGLLRIPDGLCGHARCG